MIGQVLEKSFSASGKLKLKIQTSEGPPKNYFMPEGVDGDALLGKRIDFVAGQFSFVDKKTGKTIWMDTVKEWALAQSQQAPAAPQPVGALLHTGFPKGAPSAASEPSQRALSSLFDHELKFVSNVVGQAINSCQCKTPSEVKAWFDAAVAALKGEGVESIQEQIEDALSPKDRGDQTKSANAQVKRIIEAANAGNDRLILEVYRECSHLNTSEEFEASVWCQLSTPLQNHIRDLEDMSRAESMKDDVGF